MLTQGQSSSAKKGGLAADISSGLIFLKRKKKEEEENILAKEIIYLMGLASFLEAPGRRKEVICSCSQKGWMIAIVKREFWENLIDFFFSMQEALTWWWTVSLTAV